MSVTPYYFCIAALAVLILVLLAILTLRELHHSRIEAGLIDKILEQHGLNAIPREHPLAEIVSKITEKAEEPESEPERVRLDVPGFAAFKHSYNRVMRGQEPKK